jgi:hypothetical protein
VPVLSDWWVDCGGVVVPRALVYLYWNIMFGRMDLFLSRDLVMRAFVL